MKKQMKHLLAVAALSSLIVACDKNDEIMEPGIGNFENNVTVAGALMGQNPGDGNGGTLLYTLSAEEAKNPSKEINVFENGYMVLSERTARLQSSEDGKTLFNIAYGGANGGQYSKFSINGGNNFVESGPKVDISQYATASPRWVKLFDQDKTGVAVNVTSPVVNTDANGNYQYTRGVASIVSLDLQDSYIKKNTSFSIPLSAEEEADGHHIFRLDAPVLNKAGNKLLNGTWMRKTNPATGTNASNFTRLGSKTVVVDYPSLTNPSVITSTQGFGDTSGYRSFNSFLADDGNIYQATQRDTKGSQILRINQNNTYDNSYVFNLNTALGLTGSYIQNWKYVGNNTAYVMYTHDNAPVSTVTNQKQSFLARVDLSSQTATPVALPSDVDLYLFQYQGIKQIGDELFITWVPVGKEGNIYIINTKTNAVTKGAVLKNKPGNHFIGAF